MGIGETYGKLTYDSETRDEKSEKTKKRKDMGNKFMKQFSSKSRLNHSTSPEGTPRESADQNIQNNKKNSLPSITNNLNQPTNFNFNTQNQSIINGDNNLFSFPPIYGSQLFETFGENRNGDDFNNNNNGYNGGSNNKTPRSWGPSPLLREDERLRNQNDGIKLKAKSKSGSKLDSKIKLNKNEVISRLPGKFKEKDGYARQPKIDDKK